MDELGIGILDCIKRGECLMIENDMLESVYNILKMTGVLR